MRGLRQLLAALAVTGIFLGAATIAATQPGVTTDISVAQSSEAFLD
jgi:hypothetical protein